MGVGNAVGEIISKSSVTGSVRFLGSPSGEGRLYILMQKLDEPTLLLQLLLPMQKCLFLAILLVGERQREIKVRIVRECPTRYALVF